MLSSSIRLLRNVIRAVIHETRAKPNRGWEGYARFDAEDNIDIDVGYPAAYHTQYANTTGDNDELPEINTGGLNVVSRRAVRYPGIAETRRRRV